MSLIRTFQIGLTEASPTQGLEFVEPGHSFQVVDANSASASIRATIENRRPSDRQTFKKGMGWRHVAFDRLWVHWDAQPGVTVTIAVAGRPQDARPELIEVLTAASANTVEVDNPLENPVPVEVTGTPLGVTFTDGSMPVEPVRRTHDPESTFAVEIFNSSLSVNQVKDFTEGAVPTGRPGHGDVVPVGKKVVVTDAFVNTTGFCAGLLYTYEQSSGSTGVVVPVDKNGGTVRGMIGLEVPAGYGFRFVSRYNGGNQNCAGGISGFMVDV